MPREATIRAATTKERLRDKLERLVSALAKQPVARIGGAIGELIDEGFRGQTREDPRWQIGATVYHGSPYKFGKFSSKAIGTGEGAQAYGRGLYFAENPTVAEQYAKSAYPSLDKLREYFKPGTKVKGYAGTDEVLGFNEGRGGNWSTTVRQAWDDNLNRPPDSVSSRARTHATVPDWQELKKATGKLPGYQYKVDLPDEAIGKMLDWNAPLSRQSGPAYRAGSEWGLDPQRATGKDLYSKVIEGFKQRGSPDPSASGARYLRSLGFPGVKYYDQLSRGASAGTRNYVVFDERLPRIIGVE